MSVIYNRDVNGFSPSPKKISHSQEKNSPTGGFQKIAHNPTQQNFMELKSSNSA